MGLFPAKSNSVHGDLLLDEALPILAKNLYNMSHEDGLTGFINSQHEMFPLFRFKHCRTNSAELMAFFLSMQVQVVNGKCSETTSERVRQGLAYEASKISSYSNSLFLMRTDCYRPLFASGPDVNKLVGNKIIQFLEVEDEFVDVLAGIVRADGNFQLLGQEIIGAGLHIIKINNPVVDAIKDRLK